MEIKKLLSIEVIFKGNFDSEHQYYKVLLKDDNDQQYLATIGTKINNDKSVEKAFRRLILIPAPTQEQLYRIINEESKNDKGEN